MAETVQVQPQEDIQALWKQAQEAEAAAQADLARAHDAVKKGVARLKLAQTKLEQVHKHHIGEVAQGMSGNRQAVHDAEVKTKDLEEAVGLLVAQHRAAFQALRDAKDIAQTAERRVRNAEVVELTTRLREAENAYSRARQAVAEKNGRIAQLMWPSMGPGPNTLQGTPAEIRAMLENEPLCVVNPLEVEKALAGLEEKVKQIGFEPGSGHLVLQSTVNGRTFIPALGGVHISFNRVTGAVTDASVVEVMAIEGQVEHEDGHPVLIPKAGAKPIHHWEMSRM